MFLFGAVSLLCSSNRLDRHKATMIAAIRELYATTNLRKQGVVLTTTHVQPCLEWGTALTDDDRAAGNDFACELLATQSLRVAVAAV